MSSISVGGFSAGSDRPSSSDREGLEEAMRRLLRNGTRLRMERSNFWKKCLRFIRGG